MARSDAAHIAIFRDTWVTFHLAKRIFDRGWTYRLFPWDQIIVHPLYATFGALDAAGSVEGMVSFLTNPPQRYLYVAFLAAAPWNHGPSRQRRGVGAGLLGFAVQQSTKEGYGGALVLSSTPESESFYEKLNFERSGDLDDEGLSIFRLSPNDAAKLTKKYPPLR